MGRKSFNLSGLSTFGIRAMNVELRPFVSLPLRWNSDINLTTSPFISSQKSLKEIKVNPVGTRTFKTITIPDPSLHLRFRKKV
jgi:hypothetical protein